MAEGTPVEDLVLEEIKRDCKADCPYRWGDGDNQRTSLKTRLRNRLRFRVAWGHEARVLERKLDKLRTAVQSLVEFVESGGQLDEAQLKILKGLLSSTEHDPTKERYEPPTSQPEKR